MIKTCKLCGDNFLNETILYEHVREEHKIKIVRTKDRISVREVK